MIVSPRSDALTEEERALVRELELPAVTRYAQQLCGVATNAPDPDELRLRLEELEAKRDEEAVRRVLRPGVQPFFTHPDDKKRRQVLRAGRRAGKHDFLTEEMHGFAEKVYQGLGVPREYLQGGDAASVAVAHQARKIMNFGLGLGMGAEKLQEQLKPDSLRPKNQFTGFGPGVVVPTPGIGVLTELGALNPDCGLLKEYTPTLFNADGDEISRWAFNRGWEDIINGLPGLEAMAREFHRGFYQHMQEQGMARRLLPPQEVPDDVLKKSLEERIKGKSPTTFTKDELLEWGRLLDGDDAGRQADWALTVPKQMKSTDELECIFGKHNKVLVPPGYREEMLSVQEVQGDFINEGNLDAIDRDILLDIEVGVDVARGPDMTAFTCWEVLPTKENQE